MGKAGGGNSAGLFGDDDAVLNELASALDLVEQSFLVRVVPGGFVERASSPCDSRIISSGCDGLVDGDGALRDALVLGRHDSDASSLLELRLVWAHQRDDLVGPRTCCRVEARGGEHRDGLTRGVNNAVKNKKRR